MKILLQFITIAMDAIHYAVNDNVKCDIKHKQRNVIIEHLNQLQKQQLQVAEENLKLNERISKNLSKLKQLEFLRNELMKTNQPEQTLRRLYRAEYLMPSFDTDEEMQRAYWDYYSDENIANFGESVSKYLANIFLSSDVRMKQLTETYRKVCPPGYNPLYFDKTTWTRENVKQFVQIVPQSELIRIGY